ELVAKLVELAMELVPQFAEFAAQLLEAVVEPVDVAAQDRQVLLGGDVGPADGRKQLHQRDPRLVAEGAHGGVGELETATFIDRHLPSEASWQATSRGKLKRHRTPALGHQRRATENQALLSSRSCGRLTRRPYRRDPRNARAGQPHERSVAMMKVTVEQGR